MMATHSPLPTDSTFGSQMKEPSTVTTTTRRHSSPASYIESIPIHDPADPERKNSGDLRHLHDKVTPLRAEPPRKNGLIKGFFSGRRKSTEDSPRKPQMVLGPKRIGIVSRIIGADPRTRATNRRHSTGNVKEKANTESVVHPAFMTAKEQEKRRPHSGPIATHGMPVLTTIMSAVEEDQEQQSLASQLKGQREDSGPSTIAEASPVPPLSHKHDVRPVSQVGSTEDKPRRRSGLGGWFRSDSGKWGRDSKPST